MIERNRWSRQAAADQAATLIRTLLMEAELALSVYTHTTTEQHVTDELLDLADTFEQELDDAVQLVAQSSSAVALLSIGGMLVGLQLRGQLADLSATVIAKLLVMPATALGLILLLPALGLPGLAPDLAAAALLTCALPSMSIAAALADQQRLDEVATSLDLAGLERDVLVHAVGRRRAVEIIDRRASYAEIFDQIGVRNQEETTG